MQNPNLSQFSSRIALAQYGVDRPKVPVQSLIVDETKQYLDGLGGQDQDEEFDSDSGDKEEEKPGLPDHHGVKTGKKTRGRVKIKMEFIQNKLRRYTTFSKRKTGIMKKAYELSTLTGTQVMLLVASETGHVYTFATRKLQPMITSESGKALIQTCLNSPDPAPVHQPVLQPHQPQHQQSQQQQQHEQAQPHQQTITPLSLEISPTQVNLPAACAQRMSAQGYEEPDLQYANGEEDMKTSATGSLQYNNNPSGDTFVSYVSPSSEHSSSKPVSYAVQPVGGIATIFTPAGVGTNDNSTVQIQSAQSITQEQQPQILCGQLQLHRIHPQNIILTGNSGVQPNHVLVNQVNERQNTHMVNETSHVSSTESNTAPTQHEVITFVSPEASSGTPIQMLYNPGGVMYAPSSRTLKRNDNQSGGDVVTLQHTPVIQKSGLQQDTEMCSNINRSLIEEGGRMSRNTPDDI